MIKAVLFDFDGTLADSSSGIFHTALHTVRKLGIDKEYSNEDLRRFVGPPLRKCFSVAFGLDESLLDDAVVIYREEYNRKGRFMMELYPGMNDVLLSLKNEGFYLAVASFKHEELVRSCLEYLGILDIFDSVHGSSLTADLTKGDIMKLVLSDLQINGKEAVMVGDTPSDAKGAEDAGTHFIGVSYGFGFKPGDEGYHMVSSTKELVSAVEKLNGGIL